MDFHNKYDKETLAQKLDKENFDRTTISFYRYVILEQISELRDQLYDEWNKIGMLGRIYLSQEGVNAQFSIPTHNVDLLREILDSRREFKGMLFKIAVEDEGKSFLKLIIKVKDQIVADGLYSDDYDVTNVGNHLSANQFNEALEDPETIVVDMRNHYESEVGHFVGAMLPEAETFKEELPLVAEKLKGKEEKKVLMYCTGGIRCEKASAYMRHKGFEDVNQLHGGIIDYHRQVKEQGLESKYIGKNFVFDERLGERITDDIIAYCHQCGESCDDHTNCENVACNLLFIQCGKCAEQYTGCCTPKCQSINALSEEEQFKMRQGHEQKKRFNKGLQDPEALMRKIAKQEEEGFSIP